MRNRILVRSFHSVRNDLYEIYDIADFVFIFEVGLGCDVLDMFLERKKARLDAGHFWMTSDFAPLIPS